MKIYCKHSPMFKNPDPNIRPEQKEKYVRTKPGFNDVPDWVVKDKTFISGVNSGGIQIIQERPQIAVPDKQLTKAQQRELAKSVAADIELINACTSSEDLTGIQGSLKNPDHSDVTTAVAEKSAFFEASK